MFSNDSIISLARKGGLFALTFALNRFLAPVRILLTLVLMPYVAEPLVRAERWFCFLTIFKFLLEHDYCAFYSRLLETQTRKSRSRNSRNWKACCKNKKDQEKRIKFCLFCVEMAWFWAEKDENLSMMLCAF